MEWIESFDHTIMSWMQSIGSDNAVWQSICDGWFAAFTFLCEEVFLLAAVFIVFWCINKKMGQSLMLALFLSLGVNGALKELIARPRPFLNDNFQDLRYVKMDNFFVDTLSLSSSYSFPSGHAQMAGSFYGTGMLGVKKKWSYVFFTFIILLVMYSRPYLGVHYPTDVFVGAIVGIAIAFLTSYVMNRFYHKKYWLFGGVFFIVALSLLAGYSADTVKMLGTAVGVIAGIVLDDKYIRFSTEGVWWKKAIRIVVGLALVIGLKEGLKALFALWNNPVWLDISGALRYMLVGFFAVGLWPLIFTKLKI